MPLFTPVVSSTAWWKNIIKRSRDAMVFLKTCQSLTFCAMKDLREYLNSNVVAIARCEAVTLGVWGQFLNSNVVAVAPFRDSLFLIR